jgi:mono/diheme cytochrome c family protein
MIRRSRGQGLTLEHRLLCGQRRIERQSIRPAPCRGKPLMTSLRRALALTFVLVFLGIVGSQARVGGEGAARGAPPDGASLYRTYCASCHGTSARGDGAMAQYLRLPPADLTLIQRRNRGTFPSDQVARIIDGRQAVRAHGPSDMPVWGDAFARSPIVSDDQTIEAKIRSLVTFLASLQQRPAN